MAKFTRADIRAILGDAHTEDIENRLISLHLGVVDSLKDDLTEARKLGETVTALTAERDDLKKQVETLTANSGNAAEVQAAFDAYKSQVEGEKTRTAKRSALDALLRDKVGVKRDEARALILDAANLDDYTLAEDGSISDADSHATTLGTKYAPFVTKETTKGTKTMTPPSGGGKTMTVDDIMQIPDRVERVRAIAENKELFETM